ncbi:MAG TPA: TRCF domain-containing protein, partial [Thermoguttaceae bacterium]|nr:TRCF domain-containing protein [Thermoguttaceae bacterium]
VDVDLPVEAYIPQAYVPDMRLKIDLYRRLARVSNRSELDDFAAELVDRFGPPPPVTEQLLALAALRVAAHRWQVDSIRLEDGYAVFSYASQQRIKQLAATGGGRKLRVVDHQSAYLPLKKGVASPEAILDQVKSVLQSE